MWQIYAKNNGVAIESTVSRLENALNNPSIRVRRVQYIDLFGKDPLHNLPEFWDEESGLLRKNFFVCKPKAYEYEKEIRAVILEDEDDYSINMHVDVEELIENIYISPFASHWFIDLVEDLSATRYGLSSKNIYMSDIRINRG